MSNITFKVENMRIGPWGPVHAFFNLSFGYETPAGDFVGLFTVRDFALKSTKDGGYWFQSPGKQRLDKDKQPVVDEKTGFAKWDDYFDLYRADGLGKDGGYGSPKEAWKFKDAILEAVTNKFSALSTSGNSAAPKRAAKPATTKATARVTTIEEPEAGSPFDDGDEDPFAGF